MKDHLLIRADGHAHIGLGHLVRCIALAGMLEEHYRVTFVCREVPEKIGKEIGDLGYGLRQIETEKEFLKMLDEDATAVLDGYSFDADYQNRVKVTGSRLVCIDDLCDREFVADLIINHAPGVRPDDYWALSRTRYALGPDYALLRPAFLEMAQAGGWNGDRESRRREEIVGEEIAGEEIAGEENAGEENAGEKSAGEKSAGEGEGRPEVDHGSLLICFGGSDSENLTKRTLEIALDLGRFESITIITGASYEHEDPIKAVPGSGEVATHLRAVDEWTMAATMARSGIAVVPASGILIEALAAGNKVISGYYTENQKRIYNGFLRKQAFISANDFQPDALRGAFERAGGFKKQRLVDGRSPERLRKLFMELNRD